MQWRIQDFHQGAPTMEGGAPAYYFAKFLQKTVWKWKNLNLEWGVCPCPSPYELSCCPTSGVGAALAPSGKYLPIQCLCSGVSKISQMGTPTPKVGAPAYYLANLFMKVYENERRNWTERGCVSLAPPNWIHQCSLTLQVPSGSIQLRRVYSI